jgi:hypothetical protein
MGSCRQVLRGDGFEVQFQPLVNRGESERVCMRDDGRVRVRAHVRMCAHGGGSWMHLGTSPGPSNPNAVLTVSPNLAGWAHAMHTTAGCTSEMLPLLLQILAPPLTGLAEVRAAATPTAVCGSSKYPDPSNTFLMVCSVSWSDTATEPTPMASTTLAGSSSSPSSLRRFIHALTVVGTPPLVAMCSIRSILYLVVEVTSLIVSALSY